jgi:hypothetical protein
MNWLVEFAPEVEPDVKTAAEWYESRQPGLGGQFIEEIIHVWEALASNPLLNCVVTRPKTSAGVFRNVFPIVSFMRLTRLNEA